MCRDGKKNKRDIKCLERVVRSRIDGSTLAGCRKMQFDRLEEVTKKKRPPATVPC